MQTQLEARLRIVHLFDQLQATIEEKKPLDPTRFTSIDQAVGRLDDNPILTALKRQLRCVESSRSVGAHGAAILHMRQAQSLLRRMTIPSNPALS